MGAQKRVRAGVGVGLLVFGGKESICRFFYALCLYFLDEAFYFRIKYFCTFACLEMIMVIYLL